MDTPAIRPQPTDALRPDVPTLISGLRSEPISPLAIEAAEAALEPAAGIDGGHERATALLRALMANFPAPDVEDRDAMRLARAWLLDAVLAKPIWAIEQGVRTLALSARFRPTPAEILEAIDEVSRPLRHALAEARFGNTAQRPGPPLAKGRTPEERARADEIVAEARADTRSEPEGG